jgi:hypothetical protein
MSDHSIRPSANAPTESFRHLEIAAKNHKIMYEIELAAESRKIMYEIEPSAPAQQSGTGHPCTLQLNDGCVLHHSKVSPLMSARGQDRSSGRRPRHFRFPLNNDHIADIA